ncbi:MAG: insulinase family protein [Candidatus Omnitrophica bacterium]|nr:insulinase family protein [Candidatus Omnitrophota bacterium]MCM8799381.1 insulinase family protein [Candidatus Omnitrophota bacterium]
MYEKTVLKNGLRIICFPLEDRDSVSLGIWVNAGSRFETKRIQGIAHFLEHLLFKGCRHYSCRQIKEYIEGVGGLLNGFTLEEVCCYFAKLPYKHLELALEILSDMVMYPLLLEEDIEKEKGVIKEEIKLHQDLPHSYVQQILEEILWPGHSLGRSGLGTFTSIDRIRRQDLIKFKESHYTLPNIVISACGNLNFEWLVKKVERLFNSYNFRSKIAFKKVSPYFREPEVKISVRSTSQTHLAMGFYGLSRSDPQRYSLGLIHTILGANMSSRLFNEIREKKGLVYEIATQVKYLLDTGTFIIHAGLDSKNLKTVINLIMKELNNLKRKNIGIKELKRAKEYYIGQLSLSLEDTLEHMFWIGESTITLDKTYTLNQIKDAVNQITAQQIKRLANQVFLPKKIRLALVGPIEEGADTIKSYLSK